MREHMVNSAMPGHPPSTWVKRAARLTVLWKSSIVNSVNPWDTRSSLLLADTALNLAGGEERQVWVPGPQEQGPREARPGAVTGKHWPASDKAGLSPQLRREPPTGT